jgi:hypothetical protein
MEIPKRKKGGRKRPQIKRPSLHSYATKPDWFAGLPPVLAPATLTLSPAITPMPQPEKSFGELLLEILSEAYKPVWKKDSPGSYALNRAIYAVAPHCRPEVSGWLNLGAMITFGYGFKQVVDQANRRDHY